MVSALGPGGLLCMITGTLGGLAARGGAGVQPPGEDMRSMCLLAGAAMLSTMLLLSVANAAGCCKRAPALPLQSCTTEAA